MPFQKADEGAPGDETREDLSEGSASRQLDDLGYALGLLGQSDLGSVLGRFTAAAVKRRTKLSNRFVPGVTVAANRFNNVPELNGST